MRECQLCLSNKYENFSILQSKKDARISCLGNSVWRLLSNCALNKLFSDLLYDNNSKNNIGGEAKMIGTCLIMIWLTGMRKVCHTRQYFFQHFS